MLKKEIKKNILDLKYLVFLSLLFTFMTYNISTFMYSEAWLRYLAYTCTAILYLLLIIAIVYKINRKKDKTHNFNKQN